MTVSEVSDDACELYTPMLRELYERVEWAKTTELALSIFSATSLFSAIPAFFFSPLTSCSLAVIGLASFVCAIAAQKPPPYLILAIDGGGIRGIIPAQILTLLERETGRPVRELFDCIAGTSIGGILALSLAQGSPPLSAEGARRFLKENGPKIFERTRTEQVQTLNGLRAPKYSNENLACAAQEVFQKNRLHHAATDVVITSYDLASGKPVIFSTFQTPDIRMKDAALATSAAPTYFPSYPLGNYNLVDGGLVANNPSLIALIQSKKAIDPRRDIFILSIGTGQMSLKAIPKSDSMHYGMMQWVPLLFDHLFNSMHLTQLEQLKHIQETSTRSISFFRLQPQLVTKEQEMLDNATPSNMKQLQKIATTHFQQHKAHIHKEIIEPLKKYRA